MACKIVPLLHSPTRVLQGEVIQQPLKLLNTIKNILLSRITGVFCTKDKILERWDIHIIIL